MGNWAEGIRVWDPLVRIFHWSLVLFVFMALLTEDALPGYHVLAGYAVLGLVLFRIVWGLVGTRHARFSDFLFSPRVTIDTLKDLVAFRTKRYIGHGPVGGAMVIALLISLLFTAASGLAVYGGQEYEGPLTAFMINADDFWIEAAEEIHEFFAGFTVALVLVHVAGVLISSLQHRENLIKAMITGLKRMEDLTMKSLWIIGVALTMFCSPVFAHATAVDDLLAQYQAGGGGAFNAETGRILWNRTFVDPKTGEERSCAGCHGTDIRNGGKHAQTGKPIEPMAPSVSPKRLTDIKFIEKWFTRNCKWTLGRECTRTEKGNFLMFLKRSNDLQINGRSL